MIELPIPYAAALYALAAVTVWGLLMSAITLTPKEEGEGVAPGWKVGLRALSVSVLWPGIVPTLALMWLIPPLERFVLGKNLMPRPGKSEG